MNTLESKPLLNGRGSVVFRNGRPRPLRYSEVKPRQRINYANAATGWTAASGCTVGMADIATPEGPTESLVRALATGASTNSFFDYTLPATVAPGGKYIGFYVDFYLTRPTTSSTAGTLAAGTSITIFMYVGSLGAANNIAISFDASYGWNRVFFGISDWTITNGTAAYATSTFMGFRFRIQGTTGHTHSMWIREIGWI